VGVAPGLRGPAATGLHNRRTMYHPGQQNSIMGNNLNEHKGIQPLVLYRNDGR
jgi:hypothetical protein